MSPGEWLLLMALTADPVGSPSPTEGPFDFVVSELPYSEPPGEGPFDFKVA